MAPFLTPLLTESLRTMRTTSVAGNVRRCCREPIRRIASNAGIDGAIVVERVLGGKGAFGFNARTEEYVDLVKDGVLDPTKVVRSALQNAASVAGLLITTEALITDKPEKKSGGHEHGGEDMGDGDDY